MQFEEYALRLNAIDFASRSKAKAKRQRRESASSSTRTIPIGERNWTDVEPGECSISDYPVSTKLINLLRHGRDNDGAIEFWRMKDYLQDHFVFCHHWSDENWKSAMAGGGEHKKRFQYCADSSGTILHLRALQGHSGRNLIDPSLQDNVLIPDGFFKYISHVGCAINFHSIINSGLIPGGQNLSNRKTVFSLPVDLMDKEHKDPDTIDLEAPRLSQYMHKTWKKHQNTVYRVDINLALKKGLKFYQTRSNAIILHETLPAYCIPKVVRMENGEVIHEKVYASPRLPPKISLKHDWMKELGSEVARQAKGSQPTNQTQIQIMIERGDPLFAQKTRPVPRKSIHVSLVNARTSFWKKMQNHDRTERPVVCSQNTSQTRLSRDSKNYNLEEDPNHDGTGRPVVCSQSVGSSSMLNEVETLPAHCIPKVFRMETEEIIFEKVFEFFGMPRKISLRHDWMKELGSEVARQAEVNQPTQPNPNPNHSQQAGSLDIDFRISGLPHSVVKQAANSRVRELVKKIENHPHRQALQDDLQQNNAYNPSSEKSKKMIKDIGNVELFGLFETDPKTQCKECLLYWNQGIVYCTCGHLFKESEASGGAIQCTLDLLSIQEYIIKKGRPHGHRCGKTTEQREYHQAHNLKKRDASKEEF